jgi:hypothetical protein
LSGAIRSVAKLARITFLSLALFYWIDYLGFITEGKLIDMLITPSLGVPNWSVIYIINTTPSTSFLAPLPGTEEEEAPTSTTRQQNITSFLAPLPRRGKTSARGVSHAQSFYFVYFFLYFIFACIVLSKTQKN